MTKKYLEEMARYIREHREMAEETDAASLAFIRGMMSLAIHMGRFNPRFDVERFKADCEPM